MYRYYVTILYTSGYWEVITVHADDAGEACHKAFIGLDAGTTIADVSAARATD